MTFFLTYNTSFIIILSKHDKKYGNTGMAFIDFFKQAQISFTGNCYRTGMTFLALVGTGRS